MMNLTGKRIFLGLITVALIATAFGAGIYFGKADMVCSTCKADTIDLSLFWDAYNKLQTNFINPSAIQDKQVVYGAIAGMTKSLKDPYTAFFDPDQAKAFQQDLSGSFDGIGVEVGMKKGQLTVIAPLKGGPAEKAGLKAGDLIIKIEGKSTSDISEDEAVNMIRGKKGTPVTLTVFREGWSQTKDFTLVRDTIKVPSVDWELKNSNVAYIHIHQFDQVLAGDFKKISLEILKSPAKKIVLDLRNNPGGYLEVCQEIAGWFLPAGQIVTLEDFGKGKAQQQYQTAGNASFASYPMVVLMNKGSASAAEILAGALHDNRNIQLVGEKSFGKGSVQTVEYLSDGVSFLKITIAKWLTPKGVSISEVGLNPDVKVEISDSDIQAHKDPQLDKALELIKNLQ
ncbi:S41 family peptidase [Candidatus Parcubacteria bacterium]|nr:S41 family peptidase [Candidatus Parcubacteria bacterium]